MSVFNISAQDYHKHNQHEPFDFSTTFARDLMRGYIRNIQVKDRIQYEGTLLESQAIQD